MTFLILFSAAGLLALLLAAEKRDSLVGRLIFKPLLSALFLWTALRQPYLQTSMGAWVLAGLALSWVGDLLLIFKARPLFLAGLVAFLLGHVCYAAGFYGQGGFGLANAAVLALLLAVGAAIFRWLQPHLGSMRGPVAAYILVITLMVGGAFAAAGAANLSAPARGCVLAGALLFYFSDIFVARDQFVKREFPNRLLGLPIYYAGQFLLAFAVGLAGA